MVVSEKMDKSVNKELFQFFIKSEAIFSSLFFGLVEVYDYIAQYKSLKAESRELRAMCYFWKREDIRGSVNSTMLTVEYPHSSVIDKKNTEFSPAESEQAEGLP